MTASNELAAQLLALETELQRLSTRHDPQRLDQLLEDDFVEFGVSGEIWNKQSTIASLSNEAFTPRSICDFALKPLAHDLMQVTYRGHRAATADKAAADSLRSSIWRRQEDGAWRLLFHQGTTIGPSIRR
jgi:hypothetical protein